MLLLEAGILYYVAIEFYYDRDKDMKRNRRKTTKKITKGADGSVTEEQSEETTGENTK